LRILMIKLNTIIMKQSLLIVALAVSIILLISAVIFLLPEILSVALENTSLYASDFGLEFLIPDGFGVRKDAYADVAYSLIMFSAKKTPLYDVFYSEANQPFTIEISYFPAREQDRARNCASLQADADNAKLNLDEILFCGEIEIAGQTYLKEVYSSSIANCYSTPGQPEWCKKNNEHYEVVYSTVYDGNFLRAVGLTQNKDKIKYIDKIFQTFKFKVAPRPLKSVATGALLSFDGPPADRKVRIFDPSSSEITDVTLKNLGEAIGYDANARAIYVWQNYWLPSSSPRYDEQIYALMKQNIDTGKAVKIDLPVDIKDIMAFDNLIDQNKLLLLSSKNNQFILFDVVTRQEERVTTQDVDWLELSVERYDKTKNQLTFLQGGKCGVGRFVLDFDKNTMVYAGSAFGEGGCGESLGEQPEPFSFVKSTKPTQGVPKYYCAEVTILDLFDDQVKIVRDGQADLIFEHAQYLGCVK